MNAEGLLRRLHAAYNAHDADATSALYAVDGRHRESAQNTEHVGRDAVADGLRRLFEFLPDAQWECLWTLNGPVRAVAGYRLTGTARRGGGARPVHLQGVHMLEPDAAGELISGTEDFWDRTTLQAQLADPLPSRGATGFAHACFRVADLRAALDFYGQLGFRERRRFGGGDADLHVFLGLPGDGERLELVAAADVAATTGPAHVGLTARGLDGWLEELAGAGIVPESPPAASRPGAPRVCLVYDREGNAIELIESSR